MPASCTLFLPRVVSPDEVRRFVLSLGGEWQDWDEYQPFRQGVWIDGDASAFLRGVDTQEGDLSVFPHEDLLRAESAAGAAIRGVLTIDSSRSDAGKALSRKVAKEAASRWGAVLVR